MSYYTGEVIEGTVVIETTREVSSRGLYVDFTGTEAAVITRRAGADRLPDHIEPGREHPDPTGLYPAPRRGVGEGGRPAGDHGDLSHGGVGADGADPDRGAIHVRNPDSRGRRIELPRDVFILQLCPPCGPGHCLGVRHHRTDANRDRAVGPSERFEREAVLTLNKG